MRRFVTAALLASAVATPALATSGFGCYRVNVGPGDPLVIRAEPTAASPARGEASWRDQPIIALDGLVRGEDAQPSLLDVHRSEMRRCVPHHLPLGARWCPVLAVGANGTHTGFVKRRFLDHGECP